MSKKKVKKAKKVVRKKTKAKSKAKVKAKKVVPAQSIVKQSVRALGVRKVDYGRRKLNVVLGNLTFFVVLFVISAILYSVSKTEFYLSLFFMLALIMGVFSIALLIVLLIFVFLKFLNK